MNEATPPVITAPNPAGQGAPVITELQYQLWLDEMAPFFKMGETLNEAIDDAGLERHRGSLYKKWRLKDWFFHKVSAMQSQVGKLANNILVKTMMLVNEKIKQQLPITKDELDVVKFIAEKHRTSAPHFVNRTETATAKPIEELLDELEQGEDNIDDVASEAKKQMVEANTPVQNKEQAGSGGVVSPEPNAAQVQN